MKKMIAVVLVMMLCLFSAASALTAEEVVGTWYAVAFKEDGLMLYIPQNHPMTDLIFKNGIMTIKDCRTGISSSGFWNMEGDTIVADGREYRVQDGQIIVDSGNGTRYYFAKEFPPESIWPEEIKVTDPSEFYGVWSMKRMQLSEEDDYIVTTQTLRDYSGNYLFYIYVKEDAFYLYMEVRDEFVSGSNNYTFTDGKLAFVGKDEKGGTFSLTETGELLYCFDEADYLFARCNDQVWFCENCELFVEGDTCENCGAKRPGV